MGQHADEAVTFISFLDGADGFVPSHRNRDDDTGEEDGIFEGQDRHHIGIRLLDLEILLCFYGKHGQEVGIVLYFFSGEILFEHTYGI